MDLGRATTMSSLLSQNDYRQRGHRLSKKIRINTCQTELRENLLANSNRTYSYTPYTSTTTTTTIITTASDETDKKRRIRVANNSRAILWQNEQYYGKLKSLRNVSLFSHNTTTLVLLIVVVCLLQILNTAAQTDEVKNARSALPLCMRYQACAAEVAHFPLLSETVGHMVEETANIGAEDGNNGDGSGQEIEGSGTGARTAELPVDDFPIYDEFFTSQPIFDYNTDAELSRADICRCPDESGEESGVCEFGSTDSENLMRVDNSIRLAFCQPLGELFKMKCAGRRALLRIIGDVDLKTGDALTRVNDTAVFCRCEKPAEFRRSAVEPWLDKYAFVYRCITP